MERITKIVAEYYGIDYNYLFTKFRQRQNLIIVKQMAILLIFDFHPKANFSNVGVFFNRDHSTIMYSKKTIEGDIAVNKIRKKEYEFLKEKIKSLNCNQVKYDKKSIKKTGYCK